MAKPQSDNAPADKAAERSVEDLERQAAAESFAYRGREFTVHPAAVAFPNITGKPFEDFVKDVLEEGVRHKVVLYEGRILDGRQRMRAVVENDVDVDFVDLPAGADPIRFVLSSNNHRRHVGPSQRALIARDLQKLSVVMAARSRDTPPIGSATATTTPAPEPDGGADAGGPEPLPGLEPDGMAVGADLKLPQRSTGGGPPPPAPKGGGQKKPAPGQAPAAPFEPSAGHGPPALRADGKPVVTSEVQDVVQAGGGKGDVPLAKPITVGQAADAMGVSRRAVSRADKVATADPGIAALVRDGQITLSDAEQSGALDAEPEVREAAAAAVREGDAPNLRTAVDRENEARGLQPKKKKAKPGRKAQGGEIDSDLDLPPLPSMGGSAPAAPAAPPDDAPAFEVYSPVDLVAAVRIVLKVIDLDPASSDEAQIGVQAREWFGPEENGVSRPWNGSVYCFPPLNAVSEFAGKLCDQLLAGTVPKAVFLAPSDTAPEWAQRLQRAPNLTAIVVRRGDEPLTAAPPQGGGQKASWRPPRGLTAYVFGVEPTPDAVRTLSVWGYVYVRAE